MTDCPHPECDGNREVVGCIMVCPMCGKPYSDHPECPYCDSLSHDGGDCPLVLAYEREGGE